MSVEDYLSNLQYESNLRDIPSLIYLFVLGIIGLIGNSLILIVYSRKKRETATVVFIKSIAVVDLITNVVIIPATMYAKLNTWNFSFPSLCKAYIYLNNLTAVTPAINILAIAVTRYRKICHPFGWQVSTQQARIVTIIVAILSSLYCIPYTIVHGQQTIPTLDPGINVTKCRIEDNYVNTKWPPFTKGVMIFTFLLCCVPLTILYVLIGKQAWRHRHTATSFSKGKNFPVVNSPPGTNLLDSDDPKHTTMETKSEMLYTDERDESTQKMNESTMQMDDSTKQMDKSTKQMDESTKQMDESTQHMNKSTMQMDEFTKQIDESTKQMNKSTQKCSKSSDKTVDIRMINRGVEFKAKMAAPLSSDSTSMAPRVSIKHKSECQKNVGRITRMLFVISAVYVLSNLTTLVLLFISAALPETVATLSPVPDAMYRLFIMSFLINCAVNPIIYNFYDRNFRKECNRMLRLSGN